MQINRLINIILTDCFISHSCLTVLMYVPYLRKLYNPESHKFRVKLQCLQIHPVHEVRFETVIDSNILIMRKCSEF